MRKGPENAYDKWNIWNNLCQRSSRVCSVCGSSHILLSLSFSYQWMFDTSNMTDAQSYVFFVVFSSACVLCLFVCLLVHIFSHCITSPSIDLRLLITPLVFLSFH